MCTLKLGISIYYLKEYPNTPQRNTHILLKGEPIYSSKEYPYTPQRNIHILLKGIPAYSPKKYPYNPQHTLAGGQAYPPAWYGGPGGGEPVARTNHERHATGSPATTTSSPSTEATNGSSSRSSVPPPDWEARAGACSWEWWPPDPPPEWALDGAPWEPPGLPALPPPLAGHPPYHPEGERTGAW